MSNIYNGAQCKSYSWTQSHADLEIRVRVTQVIRYQDVQFSITPNSIDIKLAKREAWVQPTNGCGNSKGEHLLTGDEILLRGLFEHRVNTESAYWLIDTEEPGIVVYLDKWEPMWWRRLLLEERVVKAGPINYTVSMDHLDDGSRMVIDKLVNEQRAKLVNKNNNNIINTPLDSKGRSLQGSRLGLQ